MRRILVPVDGSPRALEAVRYVIDLVRDGRPADVHLLTVQPPLTGDVMAFVSHRLVRDYHMDEAQNATRAARELFDRAGVPITVHIVIGHAAESIAACAHELRCSLVVMGTHGFSKIAHALIGSVSRETIHLLDPNIPLTLVKRGRVQKAPDGSPALWHPA